MVRLIIALIIIAAVVMLFGQAQQGPVGVGSGGGGTRLPGGASGTSALVPGYRSPSPAGGSSTSPIA